MNKKSTLILSSIILAVMVVTGLWWWGQSDKSMPAFREEVVTRGRIEVTVQSTGIVQPRNRLEVKPPLAGRAEEVTVQEGQVVKKGQVLLWMSSSERAALIDAARARGPEEVKRWEEFYRATPVVSPINGTVILRKLEPGQSFAANDALLVIADRLLVEAQVDETDIAQIRLRLPARVLLDAYPDESVPASVGALAYEAKSVSNVTTYTVDVVPARIPSRMRSGMTATVTFLIAAKDDTLRVPTHALREEGGQTLVLVPDADGEPHKQVVETGLSDGRLTEILTGLNEGDKVLIAQAKRDKKRSGNASPFSAGSRKPKK